MKRSLSVLAVALVALATAESPASAQLAPSLGLRAGITMPLADLESSQDMGYNLGVSLGLKPLLSPVGFRAEAAFNQFSAKSNSLGGLAGDARVFEGTGNIILDLFPMPTLSLYAIGGGGFYNTKFENSNGQTKGGINVGGGLRFGLAGFNAHLEGRWHNVFVDNGNLRYFPITIGMSF